MLFHQIIEKYSIMKKRKRREEGNLGKNQVKAFEGIDFSESVKDERYLEQYLPIKQTDYVEIGDELLEKLGIYFVYQQIEKKYKITFERFLQVYKNKEWKFYV